MKMLFGYYIFGILYYSLVIALVIYPIREQLQSTRLATSLQHLYQHQRCFFLSAMLLYFAAMTFGGVLIYLVYHNAH